MLLVLACILPLLAKATGSSADAVYIDGEEWSLLAKPLEADSAISARLYAFLPENRKWTTANYGGYDAVWEMVGDSLYLKGVSVSLYDENTGKYTEKNIKADTLHCIFDGKVSSNGIFAYWVNGKIRAGRGTCAKTRVRERYVSVRISLKNIFIYKVHRSFAEDKLNIAALHNSYKYAVLRSVAGVQLLFGKAVTTYIFECVGNILHYAQFSAANKKNYVFARKFFVAARITFGYNKIIVGQVVKIF